MNGIVVYFASIIFTLTSFEVCLAKTISFAGTLSPHEIVNGRSNTGFIFHKETNDHLCFSIKQQLSTFDTSTSRNLFSWFKGDSKEHKTNDQEDNNSNMIQQQPSTQSNEPISVGSTASMMEKFKRSQEVGVRTGTLLDEITSTTIIGNAANSRVKVFVDGQLRPIGLEIDESLEGEQLTTAILSAMQDAYSKYEVNMVEKLQVLYGSLGL